jgi:transposase-like protein
MARPSRFSPEVRERAVRMVFDHAQDHALQWAAITSIAEKIGGAAETLAIGSGRRNGTRGGAPA